ncbi:MAG: Grx4 family monothiol glutaredoxin [Janthinobacterium lividum]
MSSVSDQIKTIIDQNPVVLFMKGAKNRPQCGFSSFVVQALNKLSVDYHDIDVLTDPDIRQGIKDFSDWPTIPQLYIQGEFMGGADIVRDMMQNDELKILLQEKGLIDQVS